MLVESPRGRTTDELSASNSIELTIDDRLELLERSRPDEALSIDEEGRCPGDAQGAPELGILDDPGAGLRVSRGALESGRIEPELLGPSLVVLGRKRLLVGQELVVHLPELPLFASSFRSQGGRQGIGMHREWLMLPDDPQLVLVGTGELRQRWLGPGTERALKVGEGNDGHRSPGLAPGRVVRAKGDPH